MKRYGIIGGDRRQAGAAQILAEQGNPVATYGLGRWCADREAALEQMAEAEIVILPLPLCRDTGELNCEGCQLTWQDILEVLHPEQKIFAGKIDLRCRRMAEERGLAVTDYLEREELAVTNAAITAEAALQTAMMSCPGCLWQKRCLITGFGRIGKLLALRLQGLEAKVTVAARRPEALAWAKTMGCAAVDLKVLPEYPMDFDFIWNTVPALVFDEAQMARLPAGCVCIDLASVSGFGDPCPENCRIITARGLPGKYAPETAGGAIVEAVQNCLVEMGETL